MQPRLVLRVVQVPQRMAAVALALEDMIFALIGCLQGGKPQLLIRLAIRRARPHACIILELRF